MKNPSSGMLRHVALVRTEVSEEPSTSNNQDNKNRCIRNDISHN
jgi:hypothetical protein